MLKQLTPSAAIEAGQNGKPVVVIMTTPEHDKIKWVPLQDLLDGCIFLAEDQEPEADREPEKEKPEPGSTPPTKPGKSRKIDVGKIMALHNAGWSNVKIADEMHLHPITVGKYVKAGKENNNG